MIELGWSAPTHPVDAGTATRGIMWQHTQIRALLERARTIADLALDGAAPSPDAVASAIGDLRATMEVHMTFEERVLLPLLRDAPPVEHKRADRLLDEHHRQREMLASMHKEACAFPQLPILAAKLVFLTDWLLTDMTEEERSLRIPDALHEEVVAADQTRR